MKWKHLTTDPRYRPTYQSWSDMRKRCTHPNHHKYQHYGARGITVCERWVNDFDAFISDMGIRPPGLTIERVDNDAGYDPFNCIWADLKTQANNKRKRPVNQDRLDAKERRKQEFAKHCAEREKIRAERLASKTPYVPQSPVHGSKKMYFKHKCRCAICVEAFRVRMRRKSASIQGTPQNQKKKDYLKIYRIRKKQEYDL